MGEVWVIASPSTVHIETPCTHAAVYLFTRMTELARAKSFTRTGAVRCQSDWVPADWFPVASRIRRGARLLLALSSLKKKAVD